MLTLPKYVIVTPARNEARYIEQTIRSVIAQTVLPLKWVIVSDGSTDGMDEIVARYAAEYKWIELVRTPERQERHFAGKVHAFNAGYARLTGLAFDVIASLDADISFDDGYFSFLLQKLTQDPHLGLISGRLVDAESNRDYYDYATIGREHVSGACQVFRRECFQAIGGYRPLKSGGIDLTAVLSARARGWRTRTFVEEAYYHHRPINGAQMKGLRERLHTGRKDYLLGSHPAWEIFRSLYQMKNRPFVIGGICIFLGYTWMFIRKARQALPSDLIELRRREQMQRLRSGLLRVSRRRLAVNLRRGYNASDS